MSLSATAPTLAKAVGVTFGTYCLSDFLSNFIQVRSFEPRDASSRSIFMCAHDDELSSNPIEWFVGRNKHM